MFDFLGLILAVLPCLLCTAGSVYLRSYDKPFWWVFLLAALVFLPSIKIDHP